MKKLGLSLALTMLLAACSSGSTVADTPFNITGLFSGIFQNSTGTDSGGFILNIAEDQSGNITGNVIYNDIDGRCTFNALISSGNTAGFSVTLTADVPDGTTVQQSINGVIEIVDVSSGVTNYQLTQSNSGNTLSGTYVSSSFPSCSNGSGSGSVVMNRI